jgi:hypothetical protein
LHVQVLKWSKNLPGAQLTFQREWMLGRRLNAAARRDSMLNILLQTGKNICPPSKLWLHGICCRECVEAAKLGRQAASGGRLLLRQVAAAAGCC